MTYNLTEIETSNTIPELILAVNTLSKTFLFGGLLISIFFITLITSKQLGYDYGTSLLTASLFMTFVSAILLYLGGIGVILFGISIGITVLSLFVFGLGGL